MKLLTEMKRRGVDSETVDRLQSVVAGFIDAGRPKSSTVAILSGVIFRVLDRTVPNLVGRGHKACACQMPVTSLVWISDIQGGSE